MSTIKKTVDLQKLVQNPNSLKLLILHTPFILQISSLWKCKNLIKLDLSKNNLQRFPHIGNLVNLKFMFLHQNKLDHTILRGIFFADDQPDSYSPLSKSITWVTFWGNKNQFLARHFLINQTSVIAVDNYMVVPQQRKHSVLSSQIQPFSQKTDISYILRNNPVLNKNATQEQYMSQFWNQIRQLRKNIQIICPVIKVQKLFRGWFYRKKLINKKHEILNNKQLKVKAFLSWKKQVKYHKKLYKFLLKRNKQHYLLPLKQMRLQQIRQKMLEWAARAKKKVLLRKLSLQKQMNFYHILRSNMLMFRSLYSELQIQKSNFILIDANNFKQAFKIIDEFVRMFNGQTMYSVLQNMKYMVRQINQGLIKKQFAKFLTMNQKSYVLKLNKQHKQQPFIKKTLLLNQNICYVSNHLTSIRPLFKNQYKVHLNNKEKRNMVRLYNQLQKGQKLMIQEYIMIKASQRVLKDIVRCVYYINTQVMPIKDNKNVNPYNKIKLFSQHSVNKLSSVTIIQKFWRGYIFRKKQKANAQLCAKQYRAVVKLQRWIRNLPLRKRQQFKAQIYRIFCSIDQPLFYVQVNEYLRCIQLIQNQSATHRQYMKFLEQNLCPYIDYASKKITLCWDHQNIENKKYIDIVKYCSQVRKNAFNQNFLKSIFKCTKINQIFHNSTNKDGNIQFQRGQFSHLFHFNTLTSFLKSSSSYWIKISCNTVQQAKLRILGILLQCFRFKNSHKISIKVNQISQFKKYPHKYILSQQSIFVTKDDVDLQQNLSQIQKYKFKSKIYLKDDIDQKPKKIQQNLVIFIHDPTNIMLKMSKNMIFFQEQNKIPSQIRKNSSQINGNKKKVNLSIQNMQLTQQNRDIGNIKQQFSADLKRGPRKRQQFSRSNTQKTDMLPHVLKRILPLKKQIRSYKIQKRIKNKSRQPSFILDNASKNQRIQTQPDLSIQQISEDKKSQKNIYHYSSVKQKMKKQYMYRKNMAKTNKEHLQFHKNFLNLNNFLQQQGISQQRRRIKTELQLSNYQSADRIRISIQKSGQQVQKFKQNRMKKVQQDIKQHKLILQRHRKLKQQNKDQINRIKSIQRQNRLKTKSKVQRLKVSFAQQCFPIISRTYERDFKIQYNLQKHKQQYKSERDLKYIIPDQKNNN